MWENEAQVCACVFGGGGGECLGKYIYLCILFSHYLTSCKYYGVTPNWGSSLLIFWWYVY